MSFDNLKKIYQFSENSHKEDYWKEMFGSTNKDWITHESTSIKNSDAKILKRDIMGFPSSLP